MPFTVFDALVRAYRRTGQMTVSKATGGSTTTIVDSTQARGRDNTWKEGAAFLIYDAGGLGAAPQGEMRRISAFTASSGTFTVDTAFTAAPASGDVYGFIGEYYPLQQMIQLVNDALADIGDLPLVDTTTLDTVAGDSEYAAAVAWKRGRPTEIAVQGRTGDSADNQWRVVHDWEYVEAAPGTAGRIIFRQYPWASRDLRVRYQGPHPYVVAAADVIAEVLEPELVVAALSKHALNWQNKRLQGSDPYLLQAENDARQAFENARVERPIARPQRKNKLFIVGGQRETDYFRPPPTS
jgi:hypothetical protein